MYCCLAGCQPDSTPNTTFRVFLCFPLLAEQPLYATLETPYCCCRSLEPIRTWWVRGETDKIVYSNKYLRCDGTVSSALLHTIFKIFFVFVFMCIVFFQSTPPSRMERSNVFSCVVYLSWRYPFIILIVLHRLSACVTSGYFLDVQIKYG